MEMKVTKKMKFESMIAYFQGEETELTEADFIQFCQEQIADLDKKAAKAKERAAAKKAEADELTETVFGVLTDEYQTIAQITEAVVAQLGEEGAEITAAKVTARLTKLIKTGDVAKEQVTVEIEGKKSKKMGYKVIATGVEDDSYDPYENEDYEEE